MNDDDGGGVDDHQAEHPNDDGSSFEAASAATLVDCGHLGKDLDSRVWILEIKFNKVQLLVVSSMI